MTSMECIATCLAYTEISSRGLTTYIVRLVHASPGIFIRNRAQTDAEATAALLEYASKQAFVSTGRLLGAATDTLRLVRCCSGPLGVALLSLCNYLAILQSKGRIS